MTVIRTGQCRRWREAGNETHKQPHDAVFAARRGANTAAPWTEAIKLSLMRRWCYRTERRAPRGAEHAIVLHQISCCCSFRQELIIIQINKQRRGCVISVTCVFVCDTEADSGSTDHEKIQ